jgi:hypothetical protein
VPVRSGVGWAVQAGANINLADIATLTVGGGYGKHEHCVTWLNTSGAVGSMPTRTLSPSPMSRSMESMLTPG